MSLLARYTTTVLRPTCISSKGSSALATAATVALQQPYARQQRSLSATALLRSDGNNGDDGGAAGFNRPGPPPLPPKEQREFERLVREKANAPQFKPASLSDEKHPQYRAKPVPEFEGDVNPNTGEVGGPKNDPLRWEREWTYGGRSTDF